MNNCKNCGNMIFDKVMGDYKCYVKQRTCVNDEIERGCVDWSKKRAVQVVEKVVEVAGKDGYTPEKGKDYWTKTDKQEIVDEVLDQVPIVGRKGTGEGGEIFNHHNNTANGLYSHAEGRGTNANSPYSHAEGYDTTADDYGAHVEGCGTISTGDYSHVQGMHNVIDTNRYLHVVGNGFDMNNRSNAHTIDFDGNAWYQGDVYVGGNDQKTGSKLATESFVKQMIQEYLKGK